MGLGNGCERRRETEREEERERKTEKGFAFQNDSRILTHTHGTARGHVTTRLQHTQSLLLHFNSLLCFCEAKTETDRQTDQAVLFSMRQTITLSVCQTEKLTSRQKNRSTCLSYQRTFALPLLINSGMLYNALRLDEMTLDAQSPTSRV